MEKENWMNAILESADNIQEVVPSNALFSKITSKIRYKKNVSNKTVWLVAASIALLASLNVAVIKKAGHKNNVETLALSIDQSNQLY